tara:strand:- start:555 stop:737 length:183 start_codon:yes stop_codon:yes gene_type:complete
MINRLLLSERTKWIFVIGVVAIGAGFTAKNVISYPTECIKEEVVQNFTSLEETVRNSSIF